MAAGEDALVVYEQDGPITVGTIRTTRMLDALHVAAFGDQLMAYVQGRPGLNLLLDFVQVDYLSSAALAELLRVNQAVTAANGRFRLCALIPAIREVFKITNLDQVLTIYDTDAAAEAVKRFKRSLDIEAQEKAWDEPAT